MSVAPSNDQRLDNMTNLATQYQGAYGDEGRARYQKASSYLKDSSQSIDQLAQLLGYSEAASFIHAFQRWSGMSPSVFRKHQVFLIVERQ